MLAPYGITDSYPGLILPYSAGAVVFTGVLVKNYIDGIPEDIEEAALVDGYGRTGAFMKVTLPLIKPILALGVLLAFIGPYSDYALANAFITSPNLWTLSLGLYKASQTVGPGLNYGIFSAFSIVMALPILVLFFALQRYIVSGLTLGAVKG
jgi:arabinogalactan oligomer/maltooligosaccharide transport system permease protein